MSMSYKLFLEAQQYIPGGVNSPVRAWRAVGGNPLFIQRGRGCRVIDADGKEYVDYVGSWGPLIAGHAHPQIVKALEERLLSMNFASIKTEYHRQLGRLSCCCLPWQRVWPLYRPPSHPSRQVGWRRVSANVSYPTCLCVRRGRARRR